MNNLVALVVSTATYQDRYETFNPRWESGIEAMSATELTLQNNFVTGSEKIAYRVAPQSCLDTSDKYSNNKAFANLLGVVILPVDEFEATDCVRLSGYTLWKNNYLGIYYQSEPSLVAEKNVFVENKNGLIALVIKPSALGHMYANKTVEIKDSTFVGQTDSFDCNKDIPPKQDDNFDLTKKAAGSAAPGGGMVGLIFPNFYQADNLAPGKPWIGCMAYNAIGGLMKMTNVTFAKYTSSSCTSNFAISTNSANDDGQHPVVARETTLIDVDETNKIVYHRPNVKYVSISYHIMHTFHVFIVYIKSIFFFLVLL